MKTTAQLNPINQCTDKRILNSSGIQRTYTVVRSQHTETQSSLLIVLHGSNQSGNKPRKMSGYSFDALADKNIIVVYPDGYKSHWNDARRSIDFPARKANIDDVTFIGDLIKDCAQIYNISPKAVYIAGYSNGGQRVIRLVHEHPEWFAGAAIIAATMPAKENFLLKGHTAATNLPMFVMHGTKDPIVPYNGGTASLWGFKPRGLGLSSVDTAKYFAHRNGIFTNPTQEDHDFGLHGITRYSEKNKLSVIAYVMHGGGHTIPNRNKRANRLLGRTSNHINAADEIWKFFTKFTK